MTNAKFEFWKIITLGTGPKTADSLFRALKRKGYAVAAGARGILCQLAFAASIVQIKTKVVVCTASTTELTGKDNGSTITEIYDGIKKIGGELCPPELGPRIRLKYPDQPRCSIFIAMKPITNFDGEPRIFIVMNNYFGEWLYTYNGHPDTFFFGVTPWFFLLKSR